VLKVSLTALAREHVRRAKGISSGRSSETVYGGHEHHLRQTVIGLVAGTGLAEHVSPDEATLQVLSGHIRLRAGNDAWEGHSGDMIFLPPVRHDLQAVTDAAVLLTVVTRTA